MPAKPFKIHAPAGSAGHSDGELPVRPARNETPDRDAGPIVADRSPARAPAVADKARPGAKPFRVS